MTARNFALFIHLLGVVTVFIANGLIQRVGARIRGATAVEELRLWMSLARTTRTMFPAGTLIILASGLYLAGAGFSFEAPWVVMGIVSLVLMAALGGGVMGRGMAAIGKQAFSASSITPELAGAIARPAPWAAGGAASGLAIAALWIMVAKPGWGQSIGVPLALGLVGLVAGIAAARKR
jgi:hypothetical protein